MRRRFINGRITLTSITQSYHRRSLRTLMGGNSYPPKTGAIASVVVASRRSDRPRGSRHGSGIRSIPPRRRGGMAFAGPPPGRRSMFGPGGRTGRLCGTDCSHRSGGGARRHLCPAGRCHRHVRAPWRGRYPVKAEPRHPGGRNRHVTPAWSFGEAVAARSLRCCHSPGSMTTRRRVTDSRRYCRLPNGCCRPPWYMPWPRVAPYGWPCGPPPAAPTRSSSRVST